MAKKETKEEKTARNKALFAENRKKAQEEAQKKKAEKIAKFDNAKKSEKIEYSDELALRICEMIENGLSTREVAKIINTAVSNLFYWINTHKFFSERYAKAKEIAVDLEFEELKEIADEKPVQIYDAQANKVFDKSEILWRQQRIDVRKFRVAKLAPKKYGDKLQVDASEDLRKAIIDVPARLSREEWLKHQNEEV